jgi:hypothetical protein
MGKFTQGRFESLSLMKFVEARGDEGECDFCSSPDSQAVGLRDLFVEMSECIRHEYMPASISDDIPGPEWELDPTSLSSTELLSEFDDPLGEGELAETFCRAFDDDWILVGAMFGTHEDHLRWGWEGFVETVKSSSRFVFLHPAAGRTHEITEINTADMLDRLAQVIKNCGALILFPKGQPILRGRKHHPDAVLKSKDDLGAPPAGITPGRRMNPPGIPFFYGAHDERTALADPQAARDAAHKTHTRVQWRVCRSIGQVFLIPGGERCSFWGVPDVPGAATGASTRPPAPTAKHREPLSAAGAVGAADRTRSGAELRARTTAPGRRRAAPNGTYVFARGPQAPSAWGSTRHAANR